MPQFELRTYLDEQGRSPFENWILDLDKPAQAKVAIALSRLERGNASNVEAVGEGVSELKLTWGTRLSGVFRARRQDDRHPAVRRDQKAAEPRYRGRKSAVGGLQGAQGRASEMRMPLTRSFKEFVEIRIERDPKFRQALFAEAVQTLIEGDVETAKSVLRDYINATIGFPALAKATGMPRRA
jgi:hypothetical protein